MSVLQLPTEIIMIIAEQNVSSFVAIRSVDRKVMEYTRMHMNKYKEFFSAKISNQKEEYYQLPNGLKHGLYRQFYDDGSLQKECSFIDGKKEGREIGYHKNGSILSITNFKHGLENGNQTRFSEENIIALSCSYANGLRHGPISSYDENGVLRLKFNYVNGLKEGIYQILDENGNIVYECFYSKNALVPGSSVSY